MVERATPPNRSAVGRSCLRRESQRWQQIKAPSPETEEAIFIACSRLMHLAIREEVKTKAHKTVTKCHVLYLLFFEQAMKVTPPRLTDWSFPRHVDFPAACGEAEGVRAVKGSD